MRLSKIKLAGFKSFVDPTTIPLPTNLVGIVGPNGCGKSNTIDAVRWVMGESSAKHLRGDSLTDVIFNGSSSRKPVGQASIELVFDNSDGGIGGEYAKYNEISVKRVVTRDGQSSYYLNGTRCRRRDITDIFLGTGLGPRSYAIIEQGTISRLIEAKPEELRVFLEEAAGISKYKERRRETENRIRRTRENLDRLNDLRDELDKQLAHLQRQARTAERYKELKQEERIAKAQLQTLRWHELDSESHGLEGRIREQETALEAQTAKQRHAEAETERLREEHVEASEVFNEIQGRFYGIGADIARLEQNIHHSRERRQQQERDLAQVERSWNEAQEHLEADRRKIEGIAQALMEKQPALEEAQSNEQLSTASLAEVEAAMNEWQVRWDNFNREAAAPSETAQVEKARIQQLEQQGVHQRQRATRMEEELSRLTTEELEQEIALLTEQVAEQELTRERAEQSLQQVLEAITALRERITSESAELDQLRGELQQKRGRHASLEALQQAALGKQQGAVRQWLEGAGLDKAHRLAETLEVDADWARAVECVLGDHLEAICVDGVDPVAAALPQLEKGSITLLDSSVSAGGPSPGAGDLLLAHVRGDISLHSLLSGVRTADTLEQALAMRAGLGSGESVVTRDGIWIGPNWLRVVRDDDHAGVLHREQELRELEQVVPELEQRIAELENGLADAREQLRRQEGAREELQSQVNEAGRRHGEMKGQLNARQGRLEQVRERRTQLQSDIDELREQIATDEMEVDSARIRLEEALSRMEQLAVEREALSGERETLREQVEQTREQARRDREDAHRLSLEIQSLSTERGTTEQALERLEGQLQQIAERREELTVALASGDDPGIGMQQELDELLSRRVAVEQELKAARGRVEEIDHGLRRLDGDRMSAERAAQEVRSSLEQLRMGWQEMKVRRQTLAERVTESGFEIRTVMENMPEGASVSAWEQQVDQLGERITRLGPINLAAIEEYEQQSERKTYLDAQNDDLIEALTTLENAIRKIDRETRTRFKETFEKVNKGLQEKFPRLFGGGHAYLELTGDDLLDTGVTVMARPPGKRNSTIHLLSGGEKALTAVALVFAIFELNPSPFCMLDEVDAPLDEANVGRFCDLVREMSEQVQFIFITHNKATMELANPLCGVTMHEPGVSRLVAVDVDAALELAEVS